MQLVDFAMCETYVFILSMRKTVVRALARIAILEWKVTSPLVSRQKQAGYVIRWDRWQAVRATCMDIDATAVHMPYVQLTASYALGAA